MANQDIIFDSRKEHINSILKNSDLLNVRQMLSDYSAKLIASRGVVFQSENEEIENFFKTHKFKLIKTFLEIIKSNSLYGRTVILLKPDQDEVFKLEIIPFYFTSMLNQVYTYYEDGEKYKVVRYYEKRKLKNNKEEYFLTAEDKWSAKWRIYYDYTTKTNKKVPNPFGFIPLYEFYNSTSGSFANIQNWTNYNDISAIYYLSDIRNFFDTTNETINEVLTNLLDELHMSNSRIITQNVSQTEITTNFNKKYSRMKDFIVSIMNTGKLSEGKNITSMESNGNNLISRVQVLTDLINLVYSTAGYSFKVDNENGIATDSIIARAVDVSTTHEKILLLQEPINQLLKDILTLAPLEGEFTFYFNDATFLNSTQKLDELETKLNLGLISKVEAISIDRGISITEATKIMEMHNLELEKENKKTIIREYKKYSDGNEIKDNFENGE
jgi:hypothetical protein